MVRTQARGRRLTLDLVPPRDVLGVLLDGVEALHEEGAEVEAVLRGLIDTVDALLLVDVHDSISEQAHAFKYEVRRKQWR